MSSELKGKKESMEVEEEKVKAGVDNLTTMPQSSDTIAKNQAISNMSALVERRV